jgi:4-hydroxy-3-methylbut-2-enyl diphosphate reductase
VKIILANPRGFCAGVDRAIEIVERSIARDQEAVHVRHEIVHNQRVVDDLRAKGAVFVEEPEDVQPGSRLIFSAHGVSPAVRVAAAERRLRTLDATCPLVTKVHKEVHRMQRAGLEIIMIGHAGHVEVEGTMGQAPDGMHLVETVEEAEELQVANPSRLGCVTQTTLSVDDTRDVVATLRKRFPEIQLPRRDDICYATQNRQNAVKELTKRTELVLVVGAPASSNSNRLVEVAAKRGVPSRLIGGPEEIESDWLTGVQSVGITAGASTPEFLVEEVVRRLSELCDGNFEVESLPAVDEGIHFPLPGELRD